MVHLHISTMQWTLLLITTLALLEVVATNKWNSGYGLLSETNLKAGDYFRTSRTDPFHVFAVDEETVIYGYKGSCHGIDLWTTLIGKNKYSKWAKGMMVQKEKIDNSKSYCNFDPAVGAALAKRLIGKKLPYNRNSCNTYTYRRYFLRGKAVWNTCWYQFTFGGLSKGCPLARELYGLTVANVEHPDFVLWDKDGYEYKISDFKEYPKYFDLFGNWTRS